MVSGQEIWLGLGAALRVAGMDCVGGFCGFTLRGKRPLATQRPFWHLYHLGCHLGGFGYYYLPHQRRKTTLAMGRFQVLASAIYSRQACGATRQSAWLSFGSLAGC